MAPKAQPLPELYWQHFFVHEPEEERFPWKPSKGTAVIGANANLHLHIRYAVTGAKTNFHFHVRCAKIGLNTLPQLYWQALGLIQGAGYTLWFLITWCFNIRQKNKVFFLFFALVLPCLSKALQAELVTQRN